jgi:hypothetical protein
LFSFRPHQVIPRLGWHGVADIRNSRGKESVGRKRRSIQQRLAGGRISIRQGMNSRDDEHVMVWDWVMECGSAANLKKIPVSTFFKRNLVSSTRNRGLGRD